eukprot:2228153-Prymnesium_polylepis.1
MEAESYAFVNPHNTVTGAARELLNEVVGAAGDHAPQDDPALHLMLFILGGFIYFDAEKRPLRVNGLSFRPSQSKLYVDGPYEATANVGAAMEAARRLQPSSVVALTDAGVLERGYICPREQPGGAEVIKGVEHPNGAFLCREVGESTFDASTLRVEHTHVFRAYRVLPTPPTHTREPEGLLKAFEELSTVYGDAQKASSALEADLAEFERSRLERWLRAYGVIVPLFYAVGGYIYGMLEGWDVLDSVYFLTTTLTTVGYGDLTPTSNMSRIITIVYAPLGCIVVMSGILPGVEWVLERLSERMLFVAAVSEQALTFVRSLLRLCTMSSAERAGYKPLDLSHPELEPLPGRASKTARKKLNSVVLGAAAKVDAGAGYLKSVANAVKNRKKKLGTTGEYLHTALGPLLRELRPFSNRDAEERWC